MSNHKSGSIAQPSRPRQLTPEFYYEGTHQETLVQAYRYVYDQNPAQSFRDRDSEPYRRIIENLPRPSSLNLCTCKGLNGPFGPDFVSGKSERLLACKEFKKRWMLVGYIGAGREYTRMSLLVFHFVRKTGTWRNKTFRTNSNKLKT